MTYEQKKNAMDWAKIASVIVTGLLASFSFIFYAGKLDEKVNSVQMQINQHESADNSIHKAFSDQLSTQDNRIYLLTQKEK